MNGINTIKKVIKTSIFVWLKNTLILNYSASNLKIPKIQLSITLEKKPERLDVSVKLKFLKSSFKRIH